METLPERRSTFSVWHFRLGAALLAAALLVNFGFVAELWKANLGPVLAFGACLLASQFLPQRPEILKTVPSLMLVGLGAWFAQMGLFAPLGLGAFSLPLLVMLMAFGLPLVSSWNGFVAASLLTAAALLMSHAPIGVYLIGVAFLALAASLNQLLSEFERIRHDMDDTSLSDAGTGFGNRRALEREFGRLQSFTVRRRMPMLLMLWRVDGLTGIQETFGAGASDAYLLEFAGCLRDTLRLEDSCYRIASGEFVSLSIGIEDGSPIMNRLREKFPHAHAAFVSAESLTLGEAMAQAVCHLYEPVAPVAATVPQA